MKNINKKALQAIALLLCTILVFVYAAPSVHAKSENKNTNEENSEQNKTISVTNAGSGEGETEKDETVYVFTDANGSVNKIIVSDWLKNSDSFKTIDDHSDLRDIENLKGYETFKTAANDEKKWDVDNDNDGVRDGIWIPSGQPIRADENGRPYKCPEICTGGAPPSGPAGF